MFLKRQRHERGRDELGRPEFARLQREALENYLVGLIRAVVRLFLHILPSIHLYIPIIDVPPDFKSSVAIS